MKIHQISFVLGLLFLFSCSPEEDFYPNGLPLGTWQLLVDPGTPEVEPNRILSRSFISGLEMRKNFSGNLIMTTDVYEGPNDEGSPQKFISIQQDDFPMTWKISGDKLQITTLDKDYFWEWNYSMDGERLTYLGLDFIRIITHK